MSEYWMMRYPEVIPREGLPTIRPECRIYGTRNLVSTIILPIYFT
jgi:hypothetical protein